MLQERVASQGGMSGAVGISHTAPGKKMPVPGRAVHVGQDLGRHIRPDCDGKEPPGIRIRNQSGEKAPHSTIGKSSGLLWTAALFFRRFGFSQGGPYRPGLGPAHPTRSGWEGTCWDPYQSAVAPREHALGGVYGHSAWARHHIVGSRSARANRSRSERRLWAHVTSNSATPKLTLRV